MFARHTMTLAALGCALSLAGCASDGSGLSLTTGSVNNKATTKQAKVQVSPVCVALISQIDGLRKEGTPERIQKVALGKSETVVVKRSALAKVSELDKANAQFQSQCSAYTPAQLRSAAANTPKKATAPVPKTKKTSALAPANKKSATTTAATSQSTVKKPTEKKIVTAKKTVTAVKKQATTATTKKIATSPVKVEKTTTKKTVTAVKKSTAASTKIPVQLITKPRSAAAENAKKAATTATTTAVKPATATAKSATADAKKEAKTQAATATAPTVAFPPLGNGGFANAYGGGVVVTTTTP